MSSPPGGLEVSVVVPAFNAEDTIRRALASIRSQTRPAREIIVVDDASTDDTLSVLEDVEGSGLTILRLEHNAGAAVARNHGIAEASGDLVAFLDADDEWLPEKLEQQVALFEENPRCVLVSCDTLAYRLHGEPLRMHVACPPVRGPLAWKALLSENFIPTPTVLARRDDIQAVGGFDPELIIGEDLDLWIRLAERGDVEVADAILVRTHQRGGSLMRSHPDAEADMVLPMIAGHLDRLADRLRPGEARAILGRRHFDLAYEHLVEGDRRRAIRQALRALRHGHRPVRSLSIAIRALLLPPPAPAV